MGHFIWPADHSPGAAANDINLRAMNNPAIAVTNVSKSFSNGRVLDGISFELAAGTIMGLTGKSGCGKTTLLRTICGAQPVDEGSIGIFGKTLAAWPGVFG